MMEEDTETELKYLKSGCMKAWGRDVTLIKREGKWKDNCGIWMIRQKEKKQEGGSMKVWKGTTRRHDSSNTNISKLENGKLIFSTIHIN